MSSPPKYIRTGHGQAFYNHANSNIVTNNSNNGHDSPPPAYTRQANQSYFAENPQLDAEEGNSSYTRPLEQPTTSNNDEYIIRMPSRPFSTLGSVHRWNLEFDRQDFRTWSAFQASTNRGRAHEDAGELRSVRGGYEFRDANNDGFHPRSLRRKRFLCMNHRFMFMLASLLVLIVICVATAKAVTLFKKDEDESPLV